MHDSLNQTSIHPNRIRNLESLSQEMKIQGI